METLSISIKGIVQGVGFRPFVYNLAHSLSVKGYIANTTDGVVMTVESDNLKLFIERVRREAPPLARIMSIDIAPADFSGFSDFSIRVSSDDGRFTLLSPDVSVCRDCLTELFDRKDRRYLYPFINCTNCGPRYSITKVVPYDRANTTMNVFQMCSKCLSEYHDSDSRRFHAQPNACPVCGPRLELVIPAGDAKITEIDDPLGKTRNLLRQGKIVAIKGLGGFHLACDATNSEAIMNLRKRKRRSNKPLALMAPDIDTILRYCFVSSEEQEVLLSPKRPVVLLRKRDSNPALPEQIAPNNRHIGFMLPYTPLHFLLFSSHDDDVTGFSFPELSVLVMTSGNIAEEPIIHDNEEAYMKLSSVADAFLVHNRDIFMRLDDSVVRVKEQAPGQCSQNPLLQKYTPGPLLYFIRRSRGYVPEPVPMLEDGPDVLGCGADLKNTFTILKGNYAIPSQHIGDMENYGSLSFFEETLMNLKSVYRADPEAVAYDLHPDYTSTRWAKKIREETGKTLKFTGIQHHYAHIGSVMAENGLSGKVIGVAFDGTGYGLDGSLWGGEFLVADIAGFTRAGHIKYTPLPGGDSAAKEPWRMSVSYLSEAAAAEFMDFIGPTGFLKRYGRGSIEKIIKLAADRRFSPLSSSAGRLFDAVSALIGVCDINTFEGEAAMAIESLVLEGISDEYPVDISFRDPIEIDFSHTILKILSDLEMRTDKRMISTKFHNTVASSIISVVTKISLVNNIHEVVLSGGVFQNLYLLGRVVDGLRAAGGLSVYVNEIVPCNDAGISLGQAYIARQRIKAGYL